MVELYFAGTTANNEWTYDEDGHCHACSNADNQCDIENYATCGIVGAAYAAHDFSNDDCVCGKASPNPPVNPPAPPVGVVLVEQTDVELLSMWLWQFPAWKQRHFSVYVVVKAPQTSNAWMVVAVVAAVVVLTVAGATFFLLRKKRTM